MFPYRNKLNRLIMDTEKVHSIKHCHVDVSNWANPINCCCDGPEGGHKTWVHQQGLKTNQGASSAKTLMTHSLNKEASQLLCDAMRCRLEDGDDSGEPWTDFAVRELAPDRFWKSSMDEMISADDEGPCMGIELNIWERAKVGCFYIIKSLMLIMSIMTINFMFIFFWCLTPLYYLGTTSHRAHIGGWWRPVWRF